MLRFSVIWQIASNLNGWQFQKNAENCWILTIQTSWLTLSAISLAKLSAFWQIAGNLKVSLFFEEWNTKQPQQTDKTSDIPLTCTNIIFFNTLLILTFTCMKDQWYSFEWSNSCEAENFPLWRKKKKWCGPGLFFWLVIISFLLHF